MDNHPIPQDVTGFKFKLIGSMTVRQFAYILFGAIIAYIFWALPIFFLIKIPFVLLFAGLGVMLAFVPIDGRPMDLMLMNFLRSIPRDNQWIYKKKGVDLSFLEYHGTPHQPHHQVTAQSQTDEKRKKLTQLLQARRDPAQDLEPHETEFLDKMKGFFPKQSSVSSPPPPMPVQPLQQPAIAPTPQVQSTIPQTPVVSLSVNDIVMTAPAPPPPQPFAQPMVQAIEEPTAPVQKTVLTPLPPTPPQPEEKKEDVQIPGNPPMPSLQAPHVAMLQIGKDINHQKATSGEVTQDTSRVKTLTGEAQIAAGFPILPDIPNIILGIVKDPRGKVMSNILVEIFDKNDIPVRAFKTNPLGQFASATPLPDGEYSIHLEDPQKQHEFDTIEITLTSEIFLPLEIISIDQREKLRLSLFG